MYLKLNNKLEVSKGYVLRMLHITRIFTIILITSLIHLSAFALGQRVTIQKKNVELKTIFTEIRKQTGYMVLAQSEHISKTKPITLNLHNASLTEAMNKILEGQNLSYKVEDKTIIIFSKPQETLLVSQIKHKTIPITGKVVDATGQGIEGVTLSIKGSNTVTSTNANGEFTIDATINDILVLRMLGYDTQEVVITNSNLTVTLTRSSTELDQVVVTALGIKRDEKSLGYAVQKVQGNTLIDAKGINVATSLTGKVAGLNIRNSTEFAANPSIKLRGQDALLVIDGVPYSGLSIDNVSPDDIQEISVLKGATAAALYGSRGANGAIMITTKKGFSHKGFAVNVNSSNMFSSGFVAFPDVQTSYSSGGAGKYAVGDYVWGDKLDIGRKANQYNPISNQFEEMELISKGKNNLKNFLQQGYITNNNLNITQSGENGSLRASFSHVYNKGQYPNSKLNKIIGSLSGEMKIGDFSLDGGFTFNKRFYPNNIGAGYGGGGYMYNLVIWTGSEYDIRDYKNYWKTGQEGTMQNWMENNWYDNPYFIANEILRSDDYNLTNGYINTNYQVKPWFKLTLRTGVDTYSQTQKWRNAVSAVGGWHRKGYFSYTKADAFAINNDLMASFKGTVGDFKFDGLLGGAIYYRTFNSLNSETQNGLTVPGFYSLKASVDPIKSTPGIQKRQENSIYSRLSVNFRDLLFVDITGRNDWSSTLSKEQRSYFYPSVSGSFVFSELMNLPSWINTARVRGSWTETKKTPDIYEINNNYAISTNVWNGANASSYPSIIRTKDILPQTDRTFEVGTAINFLQNKLLLDVTYFNRQSFNRIIDQNVSNFSGFEKVKINTNEEFVSRGIEISASGTVINNGVFSWDAGVNFSTNKTYYSKLDPIYSADKPWIEVGNRQDHVIHSYYDYAPNGKIITQNGFPIKEPRQVVIGYGDPNWIYGFNNSFKYKDISLSFSIDGRVGGMAYNNMVGYMWSSGTHIDSDNEWRYDEVVNGNKSYLVDGMQIVSGTTTRDQYGNILTDTREYEPNTTKVSYEAFVRRRDGVLDYYNQTFLKLRELSIAYNIPTKYTKTIGMKNSSIGIVGQNLFLWTKEWKYSDPDVNGDNLNSPSIRYVGFNIKASF